MFTGGGRNTRSARPGSGACVTHEAVRWAVEPRMRIRRELARRYATHLVVMGDDEIVAEGDPAKVVTEDLVHEVFGLPCRIVPDPEVGTPLIVLSDRPGSRSSV